MQLTLPELSMLAELEDRAIATIEGQNWVDAALSEADKNLISMAVTWTYATLKAGAARG